MALEHLHLFVLAFMVPLLVIGGGLMWRNAAEKQQAYTDGRTRLVYDMVTHMAMTPAQYGAQQRIEQTRNPKSKVVTLTQPAQQRVDCCAWCGRNNKNETSDEGCPGCGAPR